MTVKRLMILALLAMAFGEALSQAPAASKAKPEFVGRVDVNSIMRLTQKAGIFADKIQPKSSNLLILGMIGLTVNPQMIGYDLSQPFTLLAYSDPQGVFGQWGVGAVLQRKGGESRPFMKLGPLEMNAKDFGSKSALASSEAILDNIPAELTKESGAEAPAGTPDISVWIDAQKALKGFPLAELFKPAENQAQLLPPEKLEAIHAASVRWKSFDALLRQISSLKTSLFISDDNHATISLQVTALPGSPLDAFLKGQAVSTGKLPGAISVDGASFFGAINLAPDKSLISAAAETYGKITEAIGQAERASGYAEFASALLEESNGEAGFCIGQRFGRPFEVICLQLSNEKPMRLTKAVSAIGERTSIFGLYRLRTWKSGVTSYCLLEGSNAWLLSGRFDDESAAETLSTRKKLPAIAQEAGLIAFATCDEGGVSPKMLSICLEKGSLVAKLEFTPSDLDRLPLPPPQNDKAKR